MSEALSERSAIHALAQAQREYDDALGELRRARETAATARQDRSAIALGQSERLVERSRDAAQRATSIFEQTYATMLDAQREFERALDLLTQARDVAASSGLVAPASPAIDRAETIVEQGHARLVTAGRALADPRDPSHRG